MTGYNTSFLLDSNDLSYFFIIGCARSGTTSLCNIFDTASNACCLLEPSPQLHKEARLFWENKINESQLIHILKETIQTRIQSLTRHKPICGKKNVPFSIFSAVLAKIFPCKLIYATRDGRDCVNSMRYWHSCMFGNFYREASCSPPLTARAQAVVDSLPIAEDLSDYGRPRPVPGDPYYEAWPKMTHHQMLCWYWNAWNMRILDQLETLQASQWRRVDYSSPELASHIMEAAQFLNLAGIAEDNVERMLQQRINSVRQRTGEDTAQPSWRSWSDEELDQFWEICTPAMQRLGYFTPASPAERRYTPDYGQWWMSKEVTHDFFEAIYLDRLYQHKIFYAWAKPLLEKGEITSVLDIGCGHSIGYADFFKNIFYTGLDISPKEIAWCRQHYHNSKHHWICDDFIRSQHANQYDVIISQAAIENMYDMDNFIRRMCESSKKYVYLAGFYGFHDTISEHEYIWNEHYTSYSNIFSINRAINIFKESGFTCIHIQKIITNKENNPFESLIIAERHI